MKRYKLRMNISKPEFSSEGFSKDEIETDEFNTACDAFVFVSILEEAKSHVSVAFYGKDGRDQGRNINDKELWKVWSALTYELSRSENLPDWKLQFCKVVHEQNVELIRIISEKMADKKC